MMMIISTETPLQAIKPMTSGCRQTGSRGRSAPGSVSMVLAVSSMSFDLVEIDTATGVHRGFAGADELQIFQHLFGAVIALVAVLGHRHFDDLADAGD